MTTRSAGPKEATAPAALCHDVRDRRPGAPAGEPAQLGEHSGSSRDFPQHDCLPVITSPPLAPAGGAAPSFDPRLESLRGLAALLVCVHHGMSVFADNAPLIAMEALLFAFNSAAAVIFFFVLSGYVLGRALERDGSFVPYLTRRLFRLLPPFVVIVLFSFACERLFRIDPAPSRPVAGLSAHVLAAAGMGCVGGQFVA